ncbi:MAG: tetratricopeptide repeat protein [Myxococcota bacterium]
MQGFLDRGDAYIADEKPEEAIIEFKNVLQLDPENAEAHEALSLAYLEVEKPRDAYWEMSETVRLAPDNIDARLRYGTVSAAIGDHDLSLEQADAVLRLDPNNSPAFLLRGQSRESNGDLEGAEADFRAAVKNDPDGPAFQFLLSGFLERQRRLDESESVLRDLIKIEESYLGMSSLARTVVTAGDRDDEALRLIQRVVELAKEAPVDAPKRDPKAEGGNTSLIPNVQREEAVLAAYRLLSAFHYDRGRFDEAVASLEDGIDSVESKTKLELIYQMAALYRLKGRSEEADALIHRATVESPDSATAQLVLSAFLGQQGDAKGALKAAKDALAIEPENQAARLREAELLVDLGYQEKDDAMISRGREIVDGVIAEQPESPEAHFVRAKLELAGNDIDAARESLETVLQARPEWAQARFVLGSTMAAAGDLTRARVELARAVELDASQLEAQKLLTKVHAQLGEHEFAIEQGRNFLEQRPGDAEIRIVVGQSLIRVGRGEEAYKEVEKIPEEERGAAEHFALGRLDLALGRGELGAKRLRKAAELAPGNPAVLRAMLALDREQGRLEDSVTRVAKAREAEPQSSEIAELEAEVKLLSGDPAGARAGLEKAVELEPRNVTAQLALADIARRDGDAEGMLTVLQSATNALPESAQLQYRLAGAYAQVERQPEAIEAYERSIALSSQNGQAKNDLAYLLAESGGDLDRALELAQQAKEELPDDGNAADTLGWVLLKRGVPSAAIGYLEEAAERFPQGAYEVQGIVHNHLATAYEANNDDAKAVKASRASLDFFEKIKGVAEKRGVDFEEPDWAVEARERVGRIGKS